MKANVQIHNQAGDELLVKYPFGITFDDGFLQKFP
jgi:hypothetical protein